MSRFNWMLQQLQEEWAAFEVIDALYGIRFPDDALAGRLRVWASNLRKPREVLRPGLINRVGLESWLQWNRLLPNKKASAQLGMSTESFEQVLATLDDHGLLIDTVHFSRQVVPESLVRDLPRFFPTLQQRIFVDHDETCRAIHDAVEKTYNLRVEARLCTTAHLLGEDRFAYADDVLTDEPVSLPYQVWLHFGKPMHLAPEVVSLRTYADNEAALQPYLFTNRAPRIPKLLRAA